MRFLIKIDINKCAKPCNLMNYYANIILISTRILMSMLCVS